LTISCAMKKGANGTTLDSIVIPRSFKIFGYHMSALCLPHIVHKIFTAKLELLTLWLSFQVIDMFENWLQTTTPYADMKLFTSTHAVASHGSAFKTTLASLITIFAVKKTVIIRHASIIRLGHYACILQIMELNSLKICRVMHPDYC